VTAATKVPAPFSGLPIEEVPLARAPLVRVIAQVRFENMAIFKRANFINPFVEELLGDYPLLDEGHETEIIVDTSGISQKEDSTTQIWRLRSLDHHWTVTVSRGSLAIETSRYHSRTDFICRLKRVCEAFLTKIGASVVTRLGVRYTNQVSDETVSSERLVRFFRQDARGGLSIPPDGARINHSLCDALFVMEGRSVQGRWGLLPANTLFDPTLPPVGRPTWFLDIDCYTAGGIDMAADALSEEATSLSERAYGLFRWLVTDDFIEHFGPER
jgi:uncharacterized protein (TIGR04255 family)